MPGSRPWSSSSSWPLICVGGSRRDHCSKRFSNLNYTFIVQQACRCLSVSWVFLSVEPRPHAGDKVTQDGRYTSSCCEGQHLLRHLVGRPSDESGGSDAFSRSLVPVILCKFDNIKSDRQCGQPNKNSRLVDVEVYHSVV